MATISSLIIAFILTIFGFDNLFVTAFKELFDKNITSASYYLIFLVIGFICDILSSYRKG